MYSEEGEKLKLKNKPKAPNSPSDLWKCCIYGLRIPSFSLVLCPAFVSNDLISPKFALELALFSFPSAGDVMDFKIPDASAVVVTSLSALCFVMYCGFCSCPGRQKPLCNVTGWVLMKILPGYQAFGDVHTCV